MTNEIRNILVHLDGPRRAEERLLLGRQLAAAHGASVRVLYAAVPAALMVPMAGESAGLMAETLVAFDEDRRESARRIFDACMRQPGPRASWSQVSDIAAQGTFARSAMYCDLMVLGQHDPSEPGRSVPPHFVEGVLMQSGKPAIVVPYTGPSGADISTVAIAWKETAEAARAVSAALPLLKKARRVHVLSWGGEPAGVDAPWPDLPGYLALHGIECEWHPNGPEQSGIGEQILSRCADLSADLLVMGCYGHSRSREWVLGGASRTLLESMTLPVLMSH